MRYLVTGVAGFIGFHIAERLLKDGHVVTGIDCFLNSYPVQVKRDRVFSLSHYQNFHFLEDSILNVDLKALCQETEVVFHKAAQAGVRESWGKGFEVYAANNIMGTQQILEAAIGTPVRKIVYASSSSIYGDVKELPVRETVEPQPVSTYGVSKLAGEHLCYLYWKNFQVPSITLRYFTAFGPRPRPDMVICIFTRAMLSGEEIQIFGDGEQSRGFTYVSDIVAANLKAAACEHEREVFNISGGGRVTINELIRKLEQITGKKARVRYLSFAKGDVMHAQADISKADRLLDYRPAKDFDEGLAETVASVKEFYKL